MHTRVGGRHWRGVCPPAPPPLPRSLPEGLREPRSESQPRSIRGPPEPDPQAPGAAGDPPPPPAPFPTACLLQPVLLQTPDVRGAPVLSALPLVEALLCRLSAHNTLQVLASLLAERRVVVSGPPGCVAVRAAWFKTR
mgnify:CR=1 FL=1